MLNTKNVLMLVVLSAGLLTGTAVSQVQPAFADKDECKDNGDLNCNKETQKVHQENNCKVVNENKNDDKSDKNSNEGSSEGLIFCSNFAQNPEGGDAIFHLDPFDPFSLIP